MLFDDPLDADVKTTVSRVRRADAFPGRPRPIDAFERGQEAIEGRPVAGIAQEPIEPQHGTPFHPARFITGNSRDFPWFIIPARLALSPPPVGAGRRSPPRSFAPPDRSEMVPRASGGRLLRGWRRSAGRPGC